MACFSHVSLSGKIMAASRRQYKCSQRPEYQVVPGRDAPHHNEKNILVHLIVLRSTFPFPTSSTASAKHPLEGMKASKTEVRVMQKETFQQCIEAWQKKKEKCIRLEEDSFLRGTHVHV